MIVANMDCIEYMRTLATNSVDAIVTDPPYGMSQQPDMAEVLWHWLAGDDYNAKGGGFMGKKWDSFVPGPAVWAEALRVLKPGGHLVAFASSRTYDLMATAIRLGGFEVRDQLMWLYGSGFPKSMAVDKAIDRQRHERSEILEVTRWIREARDAAGLDSKTVDLFMGTNGMAGHWTSQQSQPRVPTLEQVPALLALFGVTMEQIPPRIAGLMIELNGNKGQPAATWFMRQVVGEYQPRDTTKGVRLGMPNQPAGDHIVPITVPATEEAAKWHGWGTALKPAHEPIVLARKPLAGTVADSVRQYGTGALNIDGCRVGRAEGDRSCDVRQEAPSAAATGEVMNKRARVAYSQSGGRWPANVAHDGSTEATEGMGAASRYYYCAKATRADRDQYLEHLQPLEAGEATDRQEGSDGLNNPRAGAGRTGGMRNPHPTVKPTELMRWLCRLVTPPGGLILDPFTGSGSTGVAAVREGFNFIGCDFTPEYCEIANIRILGAMTDAN